MSDIIVINNFYENPDAIREQAFSNGVFPFVNEVPGQRSLGVSDEQSMILKTRFEAILGIPITSWDTYRGRKGQKNNTCFQLITEDEESWVHHDDTSWAGVLYLTPNPNTDAGTGLFTHIETGVSMWNPNDPTTELNYNDDKFDITKWRCNLEVKNQYNRLILYKGSFYHRSMIPGFGQNYLNGRLTQVFFFDT